MVKIRKYANGIERFLHGEKGQRFFNFAYSIGAAIVIWGALFKILHLPGGSTLLCIGMGTEIAMFILTAFDRPAKEYAWEEVFPVLDSKNPEDRPGFGGGGGGVVAGGSGVFINGDDSGFEGGEYPASEGSHAAVHGGGGGGGGTVIIGGGVFPAGGVAGGVPSGDAVNGEVSSAGVLGGGIIGGGVIGGGIAGGVPGVAVNAEEMDQIASATQDYLDQLSGISEQMTRLRETTSALNEVSSVLLNSYQAITRNSDSISRSSEGYVDRMEDLNRNIGGLNTIYEIQLKSISSQLESIDRVNRGLKDIRDMYEKSAAESAHYCEETEKMARYMKQLNSVYEKMITAMTVNMYNPMMGGQQPKDINPFASSED